MKLELKYLAPYLPYNIKYAFRCAYDHENDYEAILDWQTEQIDLLLDYSEYFLLLRPLSDLTKEIEVNGEKFVPLDLFYEMYGGGNSSKIKFKEDYYNNIIYTPYKSLSYETVQKLLEWHFNVFNLPPELWIDINTLKG